MSFWDKMTEPQPINTFFDREKRRAERLKNFERYELEMAQKEQELIEKLEKLEARNKKLSSENIVLQNKLFAMYKKNGVTLTKHTLEEILDAVSEYTSQSKESIRSKTRKPCYVWARAIFIVIAKKNYHSDKYIASFLNKDRTSIINARDAAHKHLSETDYKFINLYTNGHL